MFQAQVEGIVVVQTRKEPILIASDQRERTDGIAVFGKPLPDFPKGLFVAQSDPEGTGGKQAEFFELDGVLPKK